MPHPNDHTPDLARDMAGSEAPPPPVEAAGPGAGPNEHAASDALARVESSVGDLADEIGAICGDPDSGTRTEPGELRMLTAAIEELERDWADADPGLPRTGIGGDESPRKLESAVTASSGPHESADESAPESMGEAIGEETVTGKDAVEAGGDLDLDAVLTPDANPPLDDDDNFVPPADAAGEETGAALAAPPRSDADEPAAASKPLVADVSTLREIDDLLAGEAEEFLTGNFATVSAVLDNAEPNRGEVVAGTGPEDEPAATPGPAASRGPGSDDDSSLVGTFEEPEPESEPESVPLPAARVQQTHPATEDKAPDEPAAETDMGAAPVEPEPPGIPIPDPDDPDDDLLPDPVRAPGGTVLLVARVLRIMGLPLTFVPPRLRPIVDWVALSLVFWVPIVWVVALFVVGR